MPAFVDKKYTDDGCSIWICSACGWGVEMRNSGVRWGQCPICGVEFTHNEEANSQAAQERRADRERLKYQQPKRVKNYRLRVMCDNFGKRDDWGHCAEGTVRGYFYDSDNKMMDAWAFEHDTCPPPVRMHEYDKRLDREMLVRLIKRWHGWPMWIEVSYEDTERR